MDDWQECRVSVKAQCNAREKCFESNNTKVKRNISTLGDQFLICHDNLKIRIIILNLDKRTTTIMLLPWDGQTQPNIYLHCQSLCNHPSWYGKCQLKHLCLLLPSPALMPQLYPYCMFGWNLSERKTYKKCQKREKERTHQA